jgi:hypothetical protein
MRGPKANRLTITRSAGLTCGSMDTDSTRNVATQNRDMTRYRIKAISRMRKVRDPRRDTLRFRTEEEYRSTEPIIPAYLITPNRVKGQYRNNPLPRTLSRLTVPK